MKRAASALIVIVTFMACSAGPMPEVSSARAFDVSGDRFPSASDEPLPLDRAILGNRTDEVRRLLAEGANPNLRWGRSGDHLPLQELLNAGTGISSVAVTVQMLLDHGADPNARWCPYESRRSAYNTAGCTSARGSTALTFAAAAGRADVVAMLLRAGADPTARDWSGTSALDVASGATAFELISRELFPDVSTRDREVLSSLRSNNRTDGDLFMQAISMSDPYFPQPALPLEEQTHTNGDYAYAHYEDPMVERIRTLIRLGANVNEQVKQGNITLTPLGKAIRQGLVRSARAMLNGGADPNARECFPVASPTYTAVFDPTCSNNPGVTPLMSAAYGGRPEAVQLLLIFNADRTLKDWAGRTALDYATPPEIRNLLLN